MAKAWTNWPPPARPKSRNGRTAPSAASIDAIRGGDGEENAAALRALLAGQTGAYRDIVLLNAAAALVVSDRATDLAEGAALAAAAIDDGRAAQALERLARITSTPLAAEDKA